jgi:hypothetical protein
MGTSWKHTMAVERSGMFVKQSAMWSRNKALWRYSWATCPEACTPLAYARGSAMVVAYAVTVVAYARGLGCGWLYLITCVAPLLCRVCRAPTACQYAAPAGKMRYLG